MTLQQIRYLNAVAEAGSISKAAEQLYVAQSSISSAIKDVEKEYAITAAASANKEHSSDLYRHLPLFLKGIFPLNHL